MPLETSDINDRQILESSRQERNAQGYIRLKYTFPSGAVKTSEWLNREQLNAEVLTRWCDFVRNQLVTDANAEAEEKARAAREEALKRKRDEELAAAETSNSAAALLPGLVRPTAATQTSDSRAAAVPVEVIVPPDPVSAVDPLRFVRDQYQSAVKDAAAASAALLAAQQRVAQWEPVLRAMEATATKQAELSQSSIVLDTKLPRSE